MAIPQMSDLLLATSLSSIIFSTMKKTLTVKQRNAEI